MYLEMLDKVRSDKLFNLERILLFYMWLYCFYVIFKLLILIIIKFLLIEGNIMLLDFKYILYLSNKKFTLSNVKYCQYLLFLLRVFFCKFIFN